MLPTATFSVSSLLMDLLVVSILAAQTTASVDSFIYVGCTQQKYAPNSQYETDVDSILTSLVNSAMYTSFNKFTVGTGSSDLLYGLFQCRPNLQQSDCASCVAHSVSQLGALCVYSCGGALQLEGCLVKYDNNPFFGVEDKTVVARKCGPPIGYDSDDFTRIDSVLSYLASSGELFRVGGSGDVQGVAECVGDLSAAQCQDCVSAAIARLKNDCAAAVWGDVFLSTCYVRYSVAGDHSYSTGGKLVHYAGLWLPVSAFLMLL
ncbi:hypothetical protein Nepgr_019661 [Nepenthes gracilis]|uniref:Gnk2-homologous domain-containing protein n=1 Tax=Nepenthes gracilis TaxID=150966 RepID=A0AAD3XVF9_NEPGR|nr:hypothetical protein Nepgr_019661 [Nepenthes gracilis]